METGKNTGGKEKQGQKEDFSIEGFLQTAGIPQNYIPSYKEFLAAWGLESVEDLKELSREEIRSFYKEYQEKHPKFVLLGKHVSKIVSTAQNLVAKVIPDEDVSPPIDVSSHPWYVAGRQDLKPTLDEIKEEIKSNTIREHAKTKVVELKADLWKDEYGKKICALANYCIRERLKGGNKRCYFIGGYDEKKGPTQTEQSKVEEAVRRASQSLKSNLTPCNSQLLHIFAHPVEAEKGAKTYWFLIIEVDPYPEEVYWKGQGYEMIGGVATLMSEITMQNLRSELPPRADPSARKIQNSDPLHDKLNLDNKLIRQFGANLNPNCENNEPDEILDLLKIQNTVCAAVLFGPFYAVIQFFEHDTTSQMLMEKRYRGLYSILHNEVMNSICSWALSGEKHFEHKGIGVTVNQVYSTAALREALVNAILHCNLNYVKLDDELVWIQVFRDKVQIGNKCYESALRNADVWFDSGRVVINALLETTLRRHVSFRLIESAGSGKQKILIECLKIGKRAPIIEVLRQDTGTVWRVTVWDGQTSSEHKAVLEKLKYKFQEDTQNHAVALALWGWTGQRLDTVMHRFGSSVVQAIAEEILKLKSSPVSVVDGTLQPSEWVKKIYDEHDLSGFR